MLLMLKSFRVCKLYRDALSACADVVFPWQAMLLSN